MTLISRLVFFSQKKTLSKSSDRIKTTNISVVIPVKDNQQGINKYLEQFFKTHSPSHFPKEIIIVDNNSSPSIVVSPYFKDQGLKIHLLVCKKPGPGAARNLGVKKSSGSWILFNDSDCIPTGTMISGYVDACNNSVAYAGNVKSLANDRLSRYYESQEILVPLKVVDKGGEFIPQYLITANSLVWRDALIEAGGFNEKIKLAGGEDVDLGLRLSEIGKLSYAFNSIVHHDFNDGWRGFSKRFIRYGKGNRIVAELWGADLKPRPFRPNKKTLFNEIAAKLQYIFLLVGYLKRTDISE